MADYFNSGKFGAIVCIGPFTNANCTTQESNTDMAIGQASTLVPMPSAGSLIGIAVRSTEALATAGTVTFKAHKAGTEFADNAAPTAVITTAAQSSYGTVRPNAVTFDAGDTLGLSLTSTTTLDPTNTLDVDGYLYVKFDPD